MTLYISDLDGTLLDDRALLSPVTVSLLNEAIAAGMQFTVATARTPATVAPLMKEVNVTLPAIVMTGAALWDFRQQQLCDIKFIDLTLAERVYDFFERCNVSPFVYTIPPFGKGPGGEILEVYYPGRLMSKADLSFYEARKNLPLKVFKLGVSPSQDALRRSVLFFASGQPDTINLVAEIIKAHTGCSVSVYEDIYNPGTMLIEVFAHGVSKATAINEMRRKTGADKVVVFGDSLNDLPAFDVADLSVAVGNASLPVLQAADVIIEKNTDDAVARFLSSLYKC